MKQFTTHLEKNVEDMLYYYREEGIPSILKTVFETILKLERSNFLKEQNGPKNKGNGFYSRLARGITNFFKLKVPRDRLGLFKPVFLDTIKEQDDQLHELAFKLYTKGLTTRDIKQIFNEIYDKKISPSTISNITKSFEEERIAWQNRPIEKEYYFIFLDAFWIPVRRGITVEKEAFYISIGLKKDLKRDILGVYSIPTETYEGWREVLQDFKKRGLRKCLMVIADGITYLEEVIKEELPGTLLQKCIFHKMKNVLLRARKSDKPFLGSDLKEVFVIDDKHYTIVDGKKNLDIFINKWRKKYPYLPQKFKGEHLENYFAYLHFPYKIQRMIYTTNWVERLIKGIRKTQKHRNAFPNPDSALNLIGAFLIDFERNTYQYSLPVFIPVQDRLDEMLEEMNPYQTQFT
jgi:transposase-like protein